MLRGARTVLVVDDAAIIRDATVALLASEGYDAVAVNNGREALSLLEQGTVRPSLILLDLAMPVMDGFAFRAAQMCDSTLAAIPVIVMSGTPPVALAAAVAALRAVAGIAKPVDADALLSLVAASCSW
jgi:CheY-like chemotaxis protein